MVEPSALQYRPASGPAASLPLGRYLPPVPPGMFNAWLAENVPPGSWLLDPLGATPVAAIEAARAGYKVIVASNNPILTFLTEMLAAAPNRGELQSALAELAMLRRGEERLERHIQSLYQTPCAECGELIPADAFLWRRGESQPYARIYRCPHCDGGGDRNGDRAGGREISLEDLDRLDLPGSDALHRSRALLRVVMSEDEYREDVEQALGSYLPRPLYVIFTILNKLEGAGLPPERMRLLQALLISLMDAGNSLWPYPSGRSRPRQLIVPPQFREVNLWMALEDAAAAWAAWSDLQPDGPPLTVTHWPSLPDPELPGGAIVLFHGRVKTLTPLPDGLTPQAVISVFPRPNQAFWTLSALWSGWLWGREAALPLRNVLDRRRYDWNWHTTALHTALAALSKGIPAGTPCFGLLPDLAPGFLTAAIIAAAASGLRLEGLALRGEGDLAQALWRPAPGDGAHPNQPETSASEPTRSLRSEEAAIRAAMQAGMRADLQARGEPAPYLTLSAAAIQSLVRQGLIPEAAPGAIPGDLFTRIHAALARAFTDRGFLRVSPGRVDAPPTGEAPANADDERSWWWLTGTTTGLAWDGASDEDNAGLPLSDRVEMELVRGLARNPTSAFTQLDQALCGRFRGLQTPAADLVRLILDSYGEPAPGKAGEWRLRPGELPAQRRADLNQLRTALDLLGRRLNFHVENEGDTRVIWREADANAPAWRFFLMASSIVSRYVLAPCEDEARCVVVLPGGRARLLAAKLRRDSRLANAMQGWRLLKFRHLRQIAARIEIDRASWLAALDQDPLTEDAVQMDMFK